VTVGTIDAIATESFLKENTQLRMGRHGCSNRLRDSNPKELNRSGGVKPKSCRESYNYTLFNVWFDWILLIAVDCRISYETSSRWGNSISQDCNIY
jgi:hypothetical protein